MDIFPEVFNSVSPTVTDEVPNPSNQVSDAGSTQPINLDEAAGPISVEDDDIIFIDDVPDQPLEVTLETTKIVSVQGSPNQESLDTTDAAAALEAVERPTQHDDDLLRGSDGEDIITVYTGNACIQLS